MENYYTISAIAQEIANDQGLYSEHHYFQYESWVLAGYREAQFDFAMEIRTYLLPMNGLRIVDMPQGTIDWVKIGLKIGERVCLIGMNTDMAKINKSDECGNLIPNKPTPPLDSQPRGVNLSSYMPTMYNFRNYQGDDVSGYVDGNLGFQNGLAIKPFFDIEGKYPSMRIRFSSEMKTAAEIYIETITDGINPCGETIVNPYMYEFLRMYGHFRRVECDQSVSDSSKRYWEDKKDRAWLIASQRINSFGPEDVLNSMRKGFKLTIKK